jgi:hypothetical protein
MNIQAKVALDKQKHPESFCPHPRCLWRVVKLDHATQTYSLRDDCPGGYCPRHAGNRQSDSLARIRRAARTQNSTLVSALRAEGVLG